MKKNYNNLQRDGFLKNSKQSNLIKITDKEKTLLIRKGNELLNTGDMASAQKIFVTIHYIDGIIRVADLQYRKGKYIEAYHLYLTAAVPEKIEIITKKIAEVIKFWLDEPTCIK